MCIYIYKYLVEQDDGFMINVTSRNISLIHCDLMIWLGRLSVSTKCLFVSLSLCLSVCTYVYIFTYLVEQYDRFVINVAPRNIVLIHRDLLIRTGRSSLQMESYLLDVFLKDVVVENALHRCCRSARSGSESWISLTVLLITNLILLLSNNVGYSNFNELLY